VGRRARARGERGELEVSGDAALAEAVLGFLAAVGVQEAAVA
jgi:hypothetical protein